MDNENEELQDVEEETPEEEETTEEEHEDVSEEQEEIPEEPDDDSVTLSKSDYNKLKRRAMAYKKTPKKKSTVKQVDSVDLIKLGKKLQDYSDEELDFVTDFANSKDPEKILSALENPFVQQGISASREKAEKERLAVKPSNTQPESEAPRSLAEKLSNARTNAEKEKILSEAGLYQEPGHNPNRVVIRP